jgi:hypothetical protein
MKAIEIFFKVLISFISNYRQLFILILIKKDIARNC